MASRSSLAWRKCLQIIVHGHRRARMVTLAAIEAAAVSLSPAEKQELMLFLASRLRAEGAMPPEPHVFSADEMSRWIEEDEADLRRVREQQ